MPRKSKLPYDDGGGSHWLLHLIGRLTLAVLRVLIDDPSWPPSPKPAAATHAAGSVRLGRHPGPDRPVRPLLHAARDHATTNAPKWPTLLLEPHCRKSALPTRVPE